MKFTSLLTCGLGLVTLAGCNNPAPSTTTSSTNESAANTNSSSASANSSATNTGSSQPTIAVIPKGTTHAYWKSVQAGAEKAGKEVGAKIVFKGPLQESDRSSQIQIMEQFVADGTSAIALAPLDDKALVKPVKEATSKKIPVIIFDSALQAKVGTDFTAFVSTNNFKGGQMAGQKMGDLLKGKGKVVLLRYQEGSASTAERENGFLDGVKKFPGITVISDNRYSGATAGEAKTSALNMVDKLNEADGIFTPNESSTQGMLLALRQLGLTSKKNFVGFDTSDPLVEALKKNEIKALVAQNPTKMGYDSVKTAYAALKGEKFQATQDTGVTLVTPENLNTPAIQALLKPAQ